MVTAAQKIIKNSNHSYVRNVLHIKLVKLVNLKIRQNPALVGLENNKSGTALLRSLCCNNHLKLIC